MATDVSEKYAWIKYAVLPIMAALYPLVLPVLERQYGIDEQKREAVITEITEVMQSEETLESLSQKIEQHNQYYSQTIEQLHRQVEEFDQVRKSWMSSKAITLRLHDDGTITFTAYDGREYDAYWDQNQRVWKYVKNGKTYVIFEKED
jgi:uncharacterized coiled-coil protein SlyX